MTLRVSLTSVPSPVEIESLFQKIISVTMKSLFAGLSVLIASASIASAQNQDEQMRALKDQIDALQAQLEKIEQGNGPPDWLEQTR